MKIHADWLGILGADGFETGKKIKCIQIRLSPTKILGDGSQKPSTVFGTPSPKNAYFPCDCPINC